MTLNMQSELLYKSKYREQISEVRGHVTNMEVTVNGMEVSRSDRRDNMKMHNLRP